MEKKIEQYDVVIIGGGAAGLTAGIYCGRAKLKTIIIEKSLIGGLATYTNEIENYPGFPDGTTGLSLMENFHKQAKKFGVTFKQTDVKNVQLQDEVKIVETFRNRYESKVVIVASGGKPRLTGATNEEHFLYDKGISFCATCDAAANQGKTVLVVGSGDAAVEEGIFLSKFADKVIISVMHEYGKMDCNEIAKTEVLANPKIDIMWNTMVDTFQGDERLNTVVLKNLKTSELINVHVDSCFLFIGYLPNTELFKDELNVNSSNFLLTNEKMETNISGVFAAGDVRDKFLKQVATAVSDGAIAGYATEKYIADYEVYKNQILNEGNPSIVYLYNAVDSASRLLLGEVEKFEKNNKIKTTVVDIYKSDGLAKRLGITDTPCIVYLNNNKIVSVLKENITVENIERML